jgi:hypothetical protein
MYVCVVRVICFSEIRKMMGGTINGSGPAVSDAGVIWRPGSLPKVEMCHRLDMSWSS